MIGSSSPAVGTSEVGSFELQAGKIDLAQIRTRLRHEAEQQGTWRLKPVSGDGWEAQAEARDAES